MNNLRLGEQEMVNSMNEGARWEGTAIAISIKDLTMEDKLLSEAATKKAAKEIVGWLCLEEFGGQSKVMRLAIKKLKLRLKEQGLWE